MWTDPSNGHGSESVLIRSGRVAAISLYTLQVLASRDSPPSAAVSRANKVTMSPVSVWKTCYLD